MDISEAKAQHKGKVIISYPFHTGGMLGDRRFWMAEKNGEALNYNGKNDLIEEYLAAGETVVVLTLHRDKTATVKPVAAQQDGGRKE